MNNNLLTKKQQNHELPEGLTIGIYSGLEGLYMPNDAFTLESFASLVEHINSQLREELDNVYTGFVGKETRTNSPLAIWKNAFDTYYPVSLKSTGSHKGYYTLSKKGIDELWADFLNMVDSPSVTSENAVFSFDGNQLSFVVCGNSEFEEMD